MMQIIDIFFNPPMAIARLGGSETPLESYSWSEDPSLFGAGQTVITPQISLEIQSDGSVRPYLPSFIRFRDDFKLRPVAPFFELWAKARNTEDNTYHELPLTISLLEKSGGSLAGLTYHVTAANRKAARRTGDSSCGFVARLDVRGRDHRRRPLSAKSPQAVGDEPLVLDTNPIPLGFFQVIKPILAVGAPDEDGRKDPLVVPSVVEMGVDLGILRVRLTPAKGEVYAPPGTVSAPAPGTNRIHEIVKPENLFLNPRSSWTKYNGDYDKFNNPEPSDTYDGADIAENFSWGVVDDTCDVVIEAYLVINGVRFRAVARAFVGPPDYAPDRRHFISLADDLADREIPLEEITKENEYLTIAEVTDIFQRVFETVSLTNLDLLRNYSIAREMNGSDERKGNLPYTNAKTMTMEDKPYADKVETYLQKPHDETQPGNPHAQLPYSDAAHATHKALADSDNLVDFLLNNYERVKLMIRPPYARLGELDAKPDETPSPTRKRDARVERDNEQDMRMPPYMRSNTATALSLSWRQYQQVMDLLEYLKEKREQQNALNSTKSAEFGEKSIVQTNAPVRVDTALWRHFENVVERRKSNFNEENKDTGEREK